MMRLDDLHFGWLDTCIQAFLNDQRSVVARYAYALISSIDSATDLTKLPTGLAITRRFKQCAFLGTGLAVPAGSLALIGKELNLFNGFDEVWLSMEEPKVSKPDGVFLVALLNLREEKIPLGVCDWMRSSGCALGPGDGEGLNYVTRDETVANALQRNTMLHR